MRLPVGGEEFRLDASLIKAHVDKKEGSPRDKPLEWPISEDTSHVT